MFLLLFYYLIVTATCTALGAFFYTIVEKEAGQNKPFIFYPITGLVITVLIAQIAALFFPVNVYFFLAFIVVLILSIILKRKELSIISNIIIIRVKDLPRSASLLIAVCVLMILVFNSGPTMMDDTESYHIQMIKWIHEYGTVPGIANLHERFGFNSSWFSGISFFIPISNRLNFYTALNGLLSVWMSTYLIIRIFPSKNFAVLSPMKFGLILIFVLSVLSWPLIRGNATTSNYDFVTTFFVLVLFFESSRLYSLNSRNPFTTEYILWPAFLFTVRIINYPLLLLSAFAFFSAWKQSNWRRAALYISMPIALVVPFLARNVMLSGFPFYPLRLLGFNVDWKVDETIQTKLLTFIKYFNRVNTGFMEITRTRQIPFPEWVGTWYHYLFSYDKMILIPALIGFLISLLLFKKLRKLNRSTQLFVGVLFLQLLSWFFIAPDPRFVYGPLLCGIILPFVLVAETKIYLLHLNRFLLLPVLCAILIFSYTVLKTVQRKNHQNFVLPVKLPQPPVRKIVVSNIILHIPEKILNNWNPRCYATELPCLYIVSPNLKARGKTIKDGFKVQK